jgi:small subunit ribosomal protein S1
MSETISPATDELESSSPATTPEAPVDPKIGAEIDLKLDEPETGPPVDPKIDPEPETPPIGEPETDPEPRVDPEPDPEDDPQPVNEPEPLANEGAQAASTEELVSVQKEAVKAAEPLPEPLAPEEPEESFADIFSAFQKTSSRREAGTSQIRGTVVSVMADSVLVDIGYKSEGILPLTAFAASREQPKPGDGLQVSVKGRDTDGYYELSLFRTAIPKDWTSLERAFEQKATIVGTVTAVVKGGLHVDVGVRAFLPGSRSGARDAAELEKLVGEEIRVRITKLDVADEDVVVDRRIVSEEEALESKAKRYAEVEEGAVVDGTVRSIMDYGAFVDLGGVDGLLHISDMAWSRVTNVSDVLTVGQQLEVKVLKIDPDTKRIALGLKQLQAHPWDAVAEKYKAGDRVRGVVSRIADFGAFVELEPGVEGLVHLSEMSWSKRIHKATEVVNVGDVIDALILNINVPERRISLGLKQALGDPWVEAAARLVPGAVVEGQVSSITKFGAFISVAEGVEGMVHISEIVVDRRLNHPSDVLRVGEVVKAMVLELDKDKRQLKLSIKQLIPTSLDEFIAEHKAGDSVTGRIISVTDGIAQVELGEGIVCPCKLPVAAAVVEAAPEAAPAGKVDLSAFSSMLKNKWKTGAAASDKPKAGEDAVKPGQVRNFRITQIDSAAKRVEVELAG